MFPSSVTFSQQATQGQNNAENAFSSVLSVELEVGNPTAAGGESGQLLNIVAENEPLGIGSSGSWLVAEQAGGATIAGDPAHTTMSVTAVFSSGEGGDTTRCNLQDIADTADAKVLETSAEIAPGTVIVTSIVDSVNTVNREGRSPTEEISSAVEVSEVSFVPSSTDASSCSAEFASAVQSYETSGDAHGVTSKCFTSIINTVASQANTNRLVAVHDTSTSPVSEFPRDWQEQPL
jgi:hypothetical protein